MVILFKRRRKIKVASQAAVDTFSKGSNRSAPRIAVNASEGMLKARDSEG